MLGVLYYFSENISQILKKHFYGQDKNKLETLEEIRIRSNGRIELKYSNEAVMLNEKIQYSDILETIQKICNNSIYSYQNEICNGYITIKGGHRVGISGNCVIENNKLININYISSLNFRIARQIIGCSNELLKYILKIKENSIYNTLIISPPGVRKNYNVKGFIKKYKHRNWRDKL